MKNLHILFTSFSIIVILVTIERFSFTTGIFLPPDQFLRLHEVIQTVIFLTASVIVYFLLLAYTTNRFAQIKSKAAIFWLCLFIAGIYLYGVGEGAHEIAGFVFNTFCNTRHFTSYLCKSMFINDYYFGNILYFLGGIFITLPQLIFERQFAKLQMTNKDIILIIINSIFYAFGLFAYAAFDRVLLGLFFCIIILFLSAGFLFTYKKNFRHLPLTFYYVVSFAIATFPALIVRFH